MNINQLSDSITEFWRHTLTPERGQAIQDFINGTIDKLYNASWSSEVHKNIMQYITDSINSPMPAVWNDTTGRALEQFMRSLGG